MSLEDIDSWADNRIYSIKISLTIADAPFELKVRRFIPKKDDLPHEVWINASGQIVCWPTPPYAIADMLQAKEVIEKSIDKYAALYIKGLLGESTGEQTLLWKTYLEAFRRANPKRDDVVR
jgi:hypothetical protein